MQGVLDKGMSPPRLSEKRHRAIAILHVGWVNEQYESAAICIDHGVALAPNNLLPGIVAFRPARFGGLHALAVDHGG